MIKEGVFDEPTVIELIDRHNEFCLAETSPCKAHRLNIDQLRSPDIRFWTLWEGGRAIGCIALRELGEARGEVKSMHILSESRGSGAADTLLNHLIKAARASGISWLGLETGETANFDAAVAFYRRHGFGATHAFGDYTTDNAGRLMARGI